MPEFFGFFSADCGNIVFDALKKAQDGNGFILRFYESSGFRGNVAVKLPFPVKTVCECNLMEMESENLEVYNNSVTLFVKPNEIKTLRLIPENKR